MLDEFFLKYGSGVKLANPFLEKLVSKTPALLGLTRITRWVKVNYEISAKKFV